MSLEEIVNLILNFSKTDINDFKKIQSIGSGGTSNVYEAQHLRSKKKYAAKVITRNCPEEEYKERIRQEIRTMIYAQNSTVIKYYGYSDKDFENQNNVTLFMEYYPNGSLFSYLENVRKGLGNIKYDNLERYKMLLRISKGMMHLHDKNIIHRDLKSSNVFIDENFEVYIGDFSFSKKCNGEIMFDKICGTTQYMAPEIIKNGQYSKKTDVYAFGILMYEILTDQIPYESSTEDKLNSNQLKSKVVEQNFRPVFKYPVKKSAKELTEKCWSNNPDERPTFEEIFKQLTYFVKEEENDSENKFLDGVKNDQISDYLDDFSEEAKSFELFLNQLFEFKRDNSISDKSEMSTQISQITNDCIQSSCSPKMNKNKLVIQNTSQSFSFLGGSSNDDLPESKITITDNPNNSLKPSVNGCIQFKSSFDDYELCNSKSSIDESLIENSVVFNEDNNSDDDPKLHFSLDNSEKNESAESSDLKIFDSYDSLNSINNLTKSLPQIIPIKQANQLSPIVMRKKKITFQVKSANQRNSFIQSNSDTEDENPIYSSASLSSSSSSSMTFTLSIEGSFKTNSNKQSSSQNSSDNKSNCSSSQQDCLDENYDITRRKQFIDEFYESINEHDENSIRNNIIEFYSILINDFDKCHKCKSLEATVQSIINTILCDYSDIFIFTLFQLIQNRAELKSFRSFFENYSDFIHYFEQYYDEKESEMIQLFKENKNLNKNEKYLIIKFAFNIIGICLQHYYFDNLVEDCKITDIEQYNKYISIGEDIEDRMINSIENFQKDYGYDENEIDITSSEDLLSIFSSIDDSN